MVRVARWFADGLVILVAVLVMIRRLGGDPTAAIAGLGIGGIAVALAAQKTLENVIGGLSLIFDRAVCVGDFLKVGDASGTVDSIGLRSTRIRTLDRTILSVPNGQIANVSIETISSRDMFWFHHSVGLRYETTPRQMRAVVSGHRPSLESHPAVDRESVRARFLRFGPSSLDIEVLPTSSRRTGRSSSRSRRNCCSASWRLSNRPRRLLPCRPRRCIWQSPARWRRFSNPLPGASRVRDLVGVMGRLRRSLRRFGVPPSG